MQHFRTDLQGDRETVVQVNFGLLIELYTSMERQPSRRFMICYHGFQINILGNPCLA
jgi:hypothetical protein